MALTGHEEADALRADIRACCASEWRMVFPEPLLERGLVIVAHPDDESIACGALLQRMAEPMVAYCTDGAPYDPYFWKQRYGSREAYAELRREETRTAMAHMGVADFVFLADHPHARGGLADQQLFRNLEAAFELLSRLINERRPTALLTSAYEGGHPDHDCCNFLTAQLSRRFSVPAFEAPLYTRAHSQDSLKAGVQRFITNEGPVIDVQPTDDEAQRKVRMCGAYESQGDFLRIFDVRREILRPLPDHDYSRPPHMGKLNYEAWQWTMTGADVCAAFGHFAAKHGDMQPQQATSGSGQRV